MSNAGEGGVKPAGENKPLGAPRGKRPRIRVSCVDQLGACRCHHGHKPGDVFDFDRDRGKMCAMACHVGFPYIDILRYGGTVPGNEPGTAKFCCPEATPSTSGLPRSSTNSQPAKCDKGTAPLSPCGCWRVTERGFSPAEISSVDYLPFWMPFSAQSGR